MIMNLWVPHNTGNVLTGWATTSFSRTLPHRVSCFVSYTFQADYIRLMWKGSQENRGYS
jgi:hypothetical protein